MTGRLLEVGDVHLTIVPMPRGILRPYVQHWGNVVSGELVCTTAVPFSECLAELFGPPDPRCLRRRPRVLSGPESSKQTRTGAERRGSIRQLGKWLPGLSLCTLGASLYCASSDALGPAYGCQSLPHLASLIKPLFRAPVPVLGIRG